MRNFNLLLLVLGLGYLVACGSSSDTVSPPETKTYKVTFDVNKPSGVTAEVTNGPLVQNITEGNVAKEPVAKPSLAGYTFEDWYTTAAGTTAFAFTTKIKANTTIYAKWTKDPVSYNVTYMENKPNGVPDAVVGLPTLETIVEGNKVTAPTTIPTLNGYLFDG